MQVRYLNNADGGFAGRVEVAEGTSVLDFLTKQGLGNLERYTFTINGSPVSAAEIVDQNGGMVLHDNDRVSVVPKKMEGGR